MRATLTFEGWITGEEVRAFSWPILACSHLKNCGSRKDQDRGRGPANFKRSHGVIMVRMFKHSNDRALIDQVVIEASKATTELVSSIEQS